MKKLNIAKEKYHSGNFEGNECSKILNNIHLMQTTVQQYDIVRDAIKALEAWKLFTTCCFGTTPKDGWLSAIKAVDISWTNLHTLHGVSVPNKIHIACDHVKDYILLTEKGLGHVNDQVVEASHSALNKRLMASRYWIKNFESDTHGKMLYRGIMHFNSYNI